MPEGLSIVDGCNRQVRGLARGWPAGFGDPDGLAAGVLSDFVVSLEEQFAAVLDVVGISGLEIGISKTGQVSV